MTTTTSSTSSLERALADIELLQAAFPDEIDASIRTRPTFPLHVRLVLDASSSLVLEYSEGYPETTGLVVSSMRSPQKHRMEAVAQAVRTVALEYCGMEAGIACCAAALEAWKDGESTLLQESDEQVDEKVPITTTSVPTPKDYHWVTSSTPVVDRKSTFLAHYCLIESEDNVQPALQQLRQRSSKMQRATHHMYAWRLTQILSDGTTILKHDNDDDGEDGAGSRLAQLLQHTRLERGIVVVVSRWFGGIHLGPKRFAHIVNAARDLLRQEGLI